MREVTASPALDYTKEAMRFSVSLPNDTTLTSITLPFDPSGHRSSTASIPPCNANLSLEE